MKLFSLKLLMLIFVFYNNSWGLKGDFDPHEYEYEKPEVLLKDLKLLKTIFYGKMIGIIKS